MKTVITYTILLIASVTVLLYLLSRNYFSPYYSSGELNYYNILIAGGLLSSAIFSLVFLFSFLIRKKIAYGKNEYPPKLASTLHASIITFSFATLFTLYLFSLITPLIGLIVISLVMLAVSISIK